MGMNGTAQTWARIWPKCGRAIAARVRADGTREPVLGCDAQYSTSFLLYPFVPRPYSASPPGHGHGHGYDCYSSPVRVRLPGARKPMYYYNIMFLSSIISYYDTLHYTILYYIILYIIFILYYITLSRARCPSTSATSEASTPGAPRRRRLNKICIV